MLLKNLLKENKQVIIILNENNRKQFLRQEREEGFKWVSNKDIKESDDIAYA